MQNKAAIFLWYDGDAEEAARFYSQTFPDSRVDRIIPSTVDYPGGRAGDAIIVEATICGLPVAMMNGGPDVKPSMAFSMQVYTDDQEETDRLWSAIVDNGGAANDCGWCTDKWGYSWQITPRVLMDALSNPDRAAAKRAMEAMATMQKIDHGAIEAAVHG